VPARLTSRHERGGALAHMPPADHSVAILATDCQGIAVKAQLLTASVQALAHPGMLLGLMLLAALIGGQSARFVRVPRVVGLLLAGLLLRFTLDEFVSSDQQRHDVLATASRELSLVRDLALGMILFTIGGVFERKMLRSTGNRLVRIGACESLCTAILVMAGCTLAAILTHESGALAPAIVLSALLGVGAVATAPAATLMVLTEYESKGPITDTVLGLTGLNNIVCIVLFYCLFLTLAWCNVIDATGQVASHLTGALVTTTLGSVLLAAVLGIIISVAHARLGSNESLLLFLGILLLLAVGEKLLRRNVGATYNALLVALIAGGIFANVAIDPQRLTAAIRAIGTPIYAVFFVMAGFGLHIDDLSHMGWMGAAYVVCRVAGKRVGAQLGVRWAGGPQRTDGRLGEGLLCQAAVIIGLAGFVEATWPGETSRRFSTIVLGSVVIFELIGPLLLKRCVVHGGEVKAITLLRRPDSASRTPSILRLTLRSLAQLAGWHPTQSVDAGGDTTVRQIMRTNVQLIPESASLDEVLHFIERSGYSDFPVVHDDRAFAGMIHYRDIRDVIYDPTLRNLVTAVDLSDSSCPVLPIDLPIEEAVTVFSGHAFGALPVVDAVETRVIVGIVEQRDLLRVLHTRKQHETST